MQQLHSHALKGLNLKTTPKRLAILDLLAQEPSYVSPDEIWLKLQEQFNRIGLPTVYRNLEELAAGGVITKVLHPNRQLYYFYCPNQHHHHHFVCLNCRRVEDLNFCGMESIEKEISENFRGKILSHIVQVNGLCHTCANLHQGELA